MLINGASASCRKKIFSPGMSAMGEIALGSGVRDST
jgi:hypothetical protein